jgi:APA family basic amino acid/polyamine antiporter
VTLVTIYGQTRILYAISKDGLISPAFKKVNARTASPVQNTLIVSIVVGLVAGFVDATFLWDMVSMGTLTAFIVVSLAVPVMRAKEGASAVKGFRVPFGPYVVPGLSISACLYLMFGLSMTTYTIFIIWMTAAILTYFLYGMRNSRLN